MRRRAAVFAVFALALGAGRVRAASDPVVVTDAGALRGSVSAGVARFAGVPYAAPPVGALRWRPPQPVRAWPGVRDADRFGSICMQKVEADNGVGPQPPSEDCLTLNVFAPATDAGRARPPLPVMVWIHGGGFVNGSSGAALYDGAALARQGVIVVTLNYRLGRFGFFAHPALTAEAGAEPVADYGLMDQIAALRWVARNIARFGGDPRAVTLFGESAGGASVNRLMIIPQARGLFARAIVQSGAGGERDVTLPTAEARGVTFAESRGLKAPDAAALRALPAAAVLADEDADMFRGDIPVLDGRLLQEDVQDAFTAGREASIPYLTGSNALEIPPAWAAGMAMRAAPLRAAVAVGERAGAPDLAHALTEALFAAPARALASAHAAHGAPTFLYRFAVAPPAEVAEFGGAIHASERAYVFQTLDAAKWPTGPEDAARAREISARWVAFARSGEPALAGRTVWPPYGRDDRLMLFTNGGEAVQPTPDAARLDLVSRVETAPPS